MWHYEKEGLTRSQRASAAAHNSVGDKGQKGKKRSKLQVVHQ